MIDQKIEDFYNKKLYFSYSSLKMLMWSPSSFKKKYIDLDWKDKMEKHLIEGKAIHCMILERSLFEEKFVVSPMDLPTGKTKQLVDEVFEAHAASFDKEVSDWDQYAFGDFRTQILQKLFILDLYQALVDDKKPDKDGATRMGDDKRIDKVVTKETINYFEYLKYKGTKDIIDQKSYDYCEKAVSIIKENPYIAKLMGLNITEFDNIKVINETEYRVDLIDYPFGLKGIIDNLVIDHDQKIININDFKTTGKTLGDFPENIDFFMYWMQAAIYFTLIITHFKHLGYGVRFNFIVIDGDFQLYAFPVSEVTMKKWVDRTKDIFSKALFHYNARSYTLPEDFIKGLVCL